MIKTDCFHKSYTLALSLVFVVVRHNESYHTYTMAELADFPEYEQA
jgi:hypothetical protein